MNNVFKKTVNILLILLCLSGCVTIKAEDDDQSGNIQDDTSQVIEQDENHQDEEEPDETIIIEDGLQEKEADTEQDVPEEEISDLEEKTAQDELQEEELLVQQIGMQLMSSPVFLGATNSSDYSNNYYPLEYIETTGAQWIDTLVAVGDQNYQFDLDAEIYGAADGVQGYNGRGNRNGINNLVAGGIETSGNRVVFAAAKWVLTSITADMKRHYYSAKNGQWTYDKTTGSISSTWYFQASDSNLTLYIGGMHAKNDTEHYTDALTLEKIYGSKIYHNGTLLRNYVPALRKSDLKPGLYDLVNNVFYVNQGTGADFEYAFNINYETNGGSSISATAAKSIPSSLPTPTKNNQHFLGWYTDESLSTAVVSGQMLTEDITLYAKWEDIYSIVIPSNLNLKNNTITYSVIDNYTIDVAVSSSGTLIYGSNSLAYSVDQSNYSDLGGDGSIIVEFSLQDTPNVAGTYTDAVTFTILPEGGLTSGN